MFGRTQQPTHQQAGSQSAETEVRAMVKQESQHQLAHSQDRKGRQAARSRLPRGRSALVALALSAVLLLAGAIASGQDLQVVDVFGIWDNTVRTDGGTADGEGTASIRWGGPATSDGQSGYDFYEVPVASIGSGSPVVIGRFNHLNFPVYPPSLSSADLVITIQFDDPRITDFEIVITITFTHDETGTGDDP